MSIAKSDDVLRADIAVVGLGPVGLTLCVLLAARGASVIGIDAGGDPVPYPRAIATDDETLRTLVRLPGLADPLALFNTGQRVEVRDDRARLVTALHFAGGVHGVAGLSFFHQPALERALRRAAGTHPSARLLFRSRVRGLRDVPGGVRLDIAGGPESMGALPVEASWVVGCDGAASFVRRQRGIGYGGRTFPEPWVVVDVDTSEPLTHLPYFTYVMDRRRPQVNMPRPGGHRFEFMLLPGERTDQMARPAQVNEWLRPYLDCADPAIRWEVVRSTVYEFHSRVADRWRDGRVLLAGDAAHSMPPFGGQGLGAGVGDALALAWRLDEVRRGLSSPAILGGYESERRPRVAEMTRTARNAGALLTATSQAGATAARLTVRALDRAPWLGARWRSGAIRGPARVTVPRSERRHAGGRPLPNARVRTLAGQVVMVDDLLAGDWALLGFGEPPSRQLPVALAAALQRRGCRHLMVVAPGALAGARPPCPVVEDLDGWLLGLRRGRGAATVALIRPDRFLVAAGTGELVEAAFKRLIQEPKGTVEGCGSCSPSGGSAFTP